MSNSVKDSVLCIIQDAADNYAHIQKNIRALQQLHPQNENEVGFWLKNCLAKVLCAKPGIRTADGMVRFLEAYLRKSFNSGKEKLIEILNNFVGDLLVILIPGINSKDKAIRYRSCQVISLLLNQLEELDETTYKSLIKHLMTRVFDKDVDVRIQAAVALSRLQDSGNNYGNQDVTKTLVYLLQHDNNTTMRRTVLWNIDIDKSTSKYIVERAKDSDRQVRAILYKKLCKEALNSSTLTLEQREFVLYQGLIDSNRDVIKNTIRLLCDIWCKNLENNLVKAMETLVDFRNGKIASLVVKSLLEADFKLEIDYDDESHQITPAEAFALRTTWDHCNKTMNFNTLDTLLPPVNRHIEYMKFWYKEMKTKRKKEDSKLTLKDLIYLSRNQGYSDEIERENMIKFLEEILSDGSLDEEMVYSLISVIYVVYSNIESLCSFVSRFMENIAQHLNSDQKTTLKFGILRNGETPSNLARCFKIFNSVLRVVDKGDLEEEKILNLINNYINDVALIALKSNCKETYIYGLRALSLYMLSGKGAFMKYIDVFKDLQLEHDEIVGEYIKSLTDFALVYGINSTQDLEAIICKILNFSLNSSNDMILSLGTCSTAKLLVSQHLKQENFVKRLGLLYILSNDTEHAYLKECLSEFFSIYPEIYENRLLIQKSIVPMLEELYVCMEDEEISEASEFISKSLEKILALLKRPSEEKSPTNLNSPLPVYILQGFLMNLDNKVLRPVFAKAIQSIAVFDYTIDRLQRKIFVSLFEELMGKLNSKEQKPLKSLYKKLIGTEETNKCEKTDYGLTTKCQKRKAVLQET